MTRQERLKYCKTCNHKKFNFDKGIICSLTNNIANFEDLCENYLKDEKLVSLENFKTEKAKSKKKKKSKTNYIPEKLTLNDFGLLISINLFSVFLYRLYSYLDINTPSMVNLLVFIIVIISSNIVTILLRERKIIKYRFKENLKFNIIYSILFTSINLIYLLLVFLKLDANFFLYFSMLLVISFISTSFSFLLIIVFNKLYKISKI